MPEASLKQTWKRLFKCRVRLEIAVNAILTFGGSMADGRDGGGAGDDGVDGERPRLPLLALAPKARLKWMRKGLFWGRVRLK